MNGLCIRSNGNARFFEPLLELLEPRLLLSACAYDLDGDSFVGAGDDAILGPAWHAQGGYSFSDALTHPAATPGWNRLCDFDGDFLVGSGDYAWLSTNWGKFATDPSIVFPADPHDADESMALADAQGALPQYMWFSEWYGRMAIANDGDDYFRIEVPSNGPVVTIDCRYEYSSGDIDIELLDSTGAQVAVSAYTVDNELLVTALPAGGTYYIHVVSPNGPTGQRYDLWWVGHPPTDYHEDDDSTFEAPAQGNFPADTWYSQIFGVPGVQADTDTFMIDVPADQLLVTVDCTYSHAAGNMDLYVIDDYAQIVGFSASWDNDEHIEVLLFSGGTHYIQIIGDSTGQTYDLRWHSADTPLLAVEDTATIDEDSADNLVDVLANDIGEGLVITQVGSGWTDGSFAYITPYPNYSGFSYWSYEIRETGGMTAWGLIAVTINPLPDPPVAVHDSEDVSQGSVDYVIDVLANDSDPDGDPLTIDSVVVLSAEPIGSVWTDGDYVYFTVFPGEYFGPETLEYTISDGTGRTDTATVDLNVFTGLQNPVAVNDEGTAIESHLVNIVDVLANDYDPDTQRISIVDIPVQPSHGTASHDGLMVNYAPEEGYRGPDSFQYTIQDTTGRSATATANMFVLPPCDIHEDDDNLLQADMQGVAPHMVAPCYLLDEDYFMVEIVDGLDDRFTAELWCGTDVDMQLLDEAGAVVATSFTVAGDKFIDTTSISPGKYYIRVFVTTGLYWAQSYVIQWDRFGPGDPHEPDNSLPEAYVLGALPPDTVVAGIYNDGDLYRFQVDPGLGYVHFLCGYTYSDGELDLSLYDAGGSLLERVEGEGNRTILEDVLPAGTYYVLVDGSDGPTGQDYGLEWEARPSDDPHEEDDTIALAHAKGWLWEGEVLSRKLGQSAILSDYDYYEINVKRGFEHVKIECTFNGAAGDVDIWLLNESGVAIEGATSWFGSIEVLDTVAPEAGTYYVKVLNPGGFTGQFYDLVWTEFEYDDAHEEDNTPWQAANRGALAEETWVDGRSRDKDYYQIVVPQGHLDVAIDLRFAHSQGDLDIKLETDGGEVLAASTTSTDDEYISFTVDAPGEYYVRVGAAYAGYKGQDYQLWWNASLSDDTHEEDDDWTQADARWALPQTDAFHGTMWDEDVFRLEVPLGQEYVSITCEYDPDHGNLDLYLVDDALMPIAASTGSGDSEYIEMTVASAGTYYLMVYDAGVVFTGLDYTLSWAAAENDDAHEPDDTRSQAYAAAPLAENTSFHGRQLDSDYFKISVPFQQQYFEAQCLFNSAEGPIQLKLLDQNGKLLATGKSVAGGVQLRQVFPIQPTTDYYLVIWTVDGATGQYYDLKWIASIDDWHEEDDDLLFGYAKGATEQDVEHSGVVWDRDVWRLDVPPGRETVLIDFQDPSGQLTFELFDSTGHVVKDNTAGIEGRRDRGQIHVAVPEAGSYFLRISQYSSWGGFETGETYSFTWRDAPGAEYDWTVLWYMAADNNLEKWIADDLRDGKSVTPVPNVALAWLYDGYSGDGYTPQGRTVWKGPDIAETTLGEWDTSDPESLRAFMEWGVENYPARNYMLIVDDHGAAFSGTCSDDTNGAGVISTWALADVIESIRHMDLILFKTCNSLDMEVAYQLRYVTDYIVGHESLGYSKTWNMDEILDYVYSDPARTAEEIADELIDIYWEQNKNPSGNGMKDVVVGAVRTRYIDQLAASMEAFVETVLSDATASDWARLALYRNQARWWGRTVDIGSFMTWVAEGDDAMTASIRSAAEVVQLARSQASYHYAWLGDPIAMGLSVYYPNPTTPRLTWEYSFGFLEFATDTNWEELFLVDDDSHEQDDAHWLANEQGSLAADTPFVGKSWDIDCFLFWVSPGQEQIQVSCTFTHAEGDINLYLLDGHATVIASAETTTDNETINFTVPKHGAYYVRVADDEDAGGQEYTVQWTHSAPSPPAGGYALLANAAKIDVELVVLPNPSLTDTSATLPAGVAQVNELSPFVVEAWVRNKDGSPNGITGGYVSIQYDWNVTANALRTGGIYTSFPTSTPIGMWVESLGGQAPLGRLDYGDDEWVRLGYVEFTADAAGTCFISAFPSNEDVFACAHEGAIDWIDVEFDIPFVEFEVVEMATQVVGRHVFYNGSALDDNDPDANDLDDDAIAMDKQALRPGVIATSANCTSYSRGINGIMVDIAGYGDTPTEIDFLFTVGNSGDPFTWAMAPPASVTARPGEGENGSNRVTIIWADGEIAGCWLQITVLSDAHGGSLGLADDDVFYFGNLPGDANGDGVVDASDYIALKRAFGSGVTEPGGSADFDASGTVDYGDLMALSGGIGQRINMALSAPEQAAVPAGAVAEPAPIVPSVDEPAADATMTASLPMELPGASYTLQTIAGVLDALAHSGPSLMAATTSASRASYSQPPSQTAVRVGSMSISTSRLPRADKACPVVADILKLAAPWWPDDSARHEAPDEPWMTRLTVDIAGRPRKDRLDPIGLDVLAVSR